MNLTQRVRIGVPLAACTIALAAAMPAAAATVPSHLRVVTAAGKTLADHIQYTGATKVRSMKGSDCFGSTSSGKRHSYGAANALGLLADAARQRSRLRPLELTDAFADSFGMGICAIGGKAAPTGSFSYWYAAQNRIGLSAAADQAALSAGDRVLYYLTRGTETGLPAELELKAPRKLGRAKPFEVKVRVYDPGTGKRSPAAGAEVNGNTTNAKGKAVIRPDDAGTLVLRATRGDDVPSAKERVCIRAPEGGCKQPKGELIIGSPKRDVIKATGRADRIKPGKGKDEVRAKRGNDRVNARDGKADEINCGAGKDLARVDRKDEVRNCERVKRA